MDLADPDLRKDGALKQGQLHFQPAIVPTPGIRQVTSGKREGQYQEEGGATLGMTIVIYICIECQGSETMASVGLLIAIDQGCV